MTFNNAEWSGSVNNIAEFDLLCDTCGKRLGEHTGSTCSSPPLKKAKATSTPIVASKSYYPQLLIHKDSGTIVLMTGGKSGYNLGSKVHPIFVFRTDWLEDMFIPFMGSIAIVTDPEGEMVLSIVPKN